MILNNITDAIGKTPMLRLDRYCPDSKATVLAKLESFNPYSIKDRAARFMIRDAEIRGKLQPGGTIVEATSGNTGIALAMLAAIKGYRCILVMSEMQSEERRAMLRAMGARLILTPASGGTKAARERAMQIAEERGAFYAGQHDNEANPLAHEKTTAEELWADTEGEIDVLVAPLGTGGTLTGVARCLRKRKPSFQTVGVEPEESPFISKGTFQPHKMMGTSPGFVPGVLDRSMVNDILLVSEADAFQACRDIAQSEGILVGISSGAAALAASRLAALPEWEGKTIVCMICDSGERYLSVGELFNREGDVSS